MAIGFTYIFRVTRVFHIAHGGVYVAGAVALWWMLSKTNNWAVAVLFAITVTAIMIWLIEKAIYLPINKRQSNQSILLVASLGLYVAIVNTLALLFGNEDKIIGNSISGSFVIGNIILTKVQLIQVAFGIIATATVTVILKLSKSNLTFQSISDNESISKVLGINTEKERLKVFISGSMLALIAAILKTIEVGVNPQSGMNITLSASVVAILVSRLNILLIIAFAIALTLLQNSVEWFLNAQWKDGITFLILLLVILFRTEGIISYNLRKDTV